MKLYIYIWWARRKYLSRTASWPYLKVDKWSFLTFLVYLHSKLSGKKGIWSKGYVVVSICIVTDNTNIVKQSKIKITRIKFRKTIEVRSISNEESERTQPNYQHQAKKRQIIIRENGVRYCFVCSIWSFAHVSQLLFWTLINYSVKYSRHLTTQ